VVRSFHVSKRRFVVGPRPQAAAKAATGTAFLLQLSEPAKVRIAFQRKSIGYRSHCKCTKLTASLRRRLHQSDPRKLTRPRCVRYKRAGALKADGAVGANRIPFSGWVDGHHRLRRGEYRATIVAKDAGHNSWKPKRTRFAVLRRR
jgi:hypothetical protein